MNASVADDYSFLADVWEKVTSAEIYGENVLKVSAEVMMWTCFFAIIEYVYEMLVEMKQLDKRELRDCRTAASVKKSEEGEEEKEGIGKRREEKEEVEEGEEGEEGDKDEENDGIVKLWHGGIRHGEVSIEQKCEGDENNGIGRKCDDGVEKNKGEAKNEEEREIEKNIGGKDNLETETNVMNKEMIGGKDNFETETNVINEEVTDLDGKCLRKRILRVN